MAVEFLTDEQAVRYGSFYGHHLERFFFLDDADREKVQAKRGRTTGWASRSS